jgi:hypothetical protein
MLLEPPANYLVDALVELEGTITPAKRARPGISTRRRDPFSGKVSGGVKKAPADKKRTARVRRRAAASGKKASSSRRE